MALCSFAIFALGASLAGAKRVDVTPAMPKLPALLQGSETQLAAGFGECPEWGWGTVPPVTANQNIGKYTLLSCLHGAMDGEAWMAKSDIDGKMVTLKVLKSTNPSASAKLRKECLFGQMAAQRDSEHFLDCLEFGIDESSGTTRTYVVMELASGTDYMSLLVEKQSEFWVHLKPLVSFWTQLVGAYEASYKTSSGDQFKLIHPHIHMGNIVVDFEAGSEEPGLKIINYAETRICCAGGQPDKCKAALRDGTTAAPSAPEALEMCRESSSSKAKLQRVSLGNIASTILDTEAMTTLVTKRTGDFKAALKKVAAAPEEYLVDPLKTELASAQPEVKNKFLEAFSMLLILLTEENPNQAELLDTCFPPSLPDKLRELQALLTR